MTLVWECLVQYGNKPYLASRPGGLALRLSGSLALRILDPRYIRRESLRAPRLARHSSSLEGRVHVTWRSGNQARTRHHTGRSRTAGRMAAWTHGRLAAWLPHCLAAWPLGHLPARLPAHLPACPPDRLPALLPA